MIGASVPEVTPGFRHEAMWYADREEFLASATGWVAEGVDAGEPILAALDPGSIEAIAGRLGGRGVAVEWVDIRTVGANPARIIPVWRGFVDRYPADAKLRGLGEPVWHGRTDDELAECAIHESLLNLALADRVHLELRCPYDVDSLDPTTLRVAERNHPRVVDVAGSRPNDRFAPVAHPPALSSVPHEAVIRSFDKTDLPTLRAWLSGLGAERGGLARSGVDDLVLAVGEVVSNSIQHGGGTGVVSLWTTDRGVVCEVRDRGWIRDPLVGRRRPDPDQPGGYGLWVANQVSDLVQLRSSAGRTVVRVHIARDH